jgi:hypothetical protein
MVTTIGVADFNIKQNDTSPFKRVILTGADEANNPLNLTGASVKYIMRPQAAGSTVKVNAAAVIISATTPVTVEYRWVAADTDTIGWFIDEWQVTFAGGAVETFPNTRHGSVLVHDDLAD